MKTMTDKMKTALLGFLDAHDRGVAIYAPKGCNGHTKNALERNRLIKWSGGAGWELTQAGMEAAQRISDEEWGIGGEWVPTGETVDEVVARDLSHRK